MNSLPPVRFGEARFHTLLGIDRSHPAALSVGRMTRLQDDGPIMRIMASVLQRLGRTEGGIMEAVHDPTAPHEVRVARASDPQKDRTPIFIGSGFHNPDPTWELNEANFFMATRHLPQPKWPISRRMHDKNWFLGPKLMEQYNLKRRQDEQNLGRLNSLVAEVVNEVFHGEETQERGFRRQGRRAVRQEQRATGADRTPIGLAYSPRPSGVSFRQHGKHVVLMSAGNGNYRPFKAIFDLQGNFIRSQMITQHELKRAKVSQY